MITDSGNGGARTIRPIVYRLSSLPYDMTSPISWRHPGHFFYGASANGGAMVTLTNCGAPGENGKGHGFSGTFRVKTDEVDKDILFWGGWPTSNGPTLKYECILETETNHRTCKLILGRWSCPFCLTCFWVLSYLSGRVFIIYHGGKYGGACNLVRLNMYQSSFWLFMFGSSFELYVQYKN